MVQVGRWEEEHGTEAPSLSRKVLTLKVPSFAGRAKPGTAPPQAQPPSEEGRVTVVRGQERGRAEGVTGSSRPRAFWRGCPVSLGEQPRR